jgi:hypothetical protein
VRVIVIAMRCARRLVVMTGRKVRQGAGEIVVGSFGHQSAPDDPFILRHLPLGAQNPCRWRISDYLDRWRCDYIAVSGWAKGAIRQAACGCRFVLPGRSPGVPAASPRLCA